MPHAKQNRKAYDSAWRDRNREALRKRQHDWYMAHRDECIQRAIARKQRKREVHDTPWRRLDQALNRLAAAHFSRLVA